MEIIQMQSKYINAVIVINNMKVIVIIQIKYNITSAQFGLLKTTILCIVEGGGRYLCMDVFTLCIIIRNCNAYRRVT